MRKNIFFKGLVFGIIAFLIGTNFILNTHVKSLESNNTTEWFEDFNDGDISDWTVQNPYVPGTNPVTISVSNAQWHSSPYSLLVDSPHQSGYTGKASGPYLPVNLSQPYTVEFWFRWNDFHWADFLGFGHIGAVLDYPYNPIILYSNGYHSVGPSVQSYCPANTWTHFQFNVNPVTSSYTMVVNGNTILTFNYVIPNPDVTQFFLVDTGSSSNDYFDHCYYDDIHITYVSENLPPVFGAPNPVNGTTNQPLSFPWSIPINDPEGDLFSWSIDCSNGQSNSGTGASNGTKSLTLSGLAYFTTYMIWVNATDPSGSGQYNRNWFTFTTKANVAPILGTPNPTNGSTNHPTSLTWSIPIYEPDELITWTIQCSNGQSSSGNNEPSGIKSLVLTGLSYATIYKVWVNATDGYDWVRGWFTFMTMENQPPVASFIYTIAELSVIFNASSSYDPDGNITTWNWDFGDGTLGEGKVVVHNYLTSGIYNATLTVVDDKGGDDSITKSITVEKYQRAFIFGKIKNLVSQGDFIQFEAIKTRVITTNPFSFNTYSSGEKFILSKEYKGKISIKFIFALCKIRI